MISAGLVMLFAVTGIWLVASLAHITHSLWVKKKPARNYLLTTWNPLVFLFTRPYLLVRYLLKITLKHQRGDNTTLWDIEMGRVQAMNEDIYVPPLPKAESQGVEGDSAQFPAHLFGFGVPAGPELDLGLRNQIPIHVRKFEANGETFITTVAPPQVPKAPTQTSVPSIRYSPIDMPYQEDYISRWGNPYSGEGSSVPVLETTPPKRVLSRTRTGGVARESSGSLRTRTSRYASQPFEITEELDVVDLDPNG